MSIVYVVRCVYCDGIDYQDWIGSIHSTEQGAIAAGEMLVKEETDVYYKIEQWEVLE